MHSLPLSTVARAPATRTVISTQAECSTEEWWDLWRRDPEATPFHSPGWLLPWRRHFPEGESVVVTLRQESRLVGLLPLFRLDSRLVLWGAGTSDWLGGLFDPALEGQALSRALSALDEPLDLFQLPPASLLASCPVPEGWEERKGLSESSPALSLPARLSANMRQNLAYYRRRAARLGICVQAGMPEHIGDLAALHTRRWHERAQPGVFADPRFLAWQEEVVPLIEEAGFLRLYVVQLEVTVVAVIYVLAAKGRAFYFIGGFDPAHGRLGLGTILVGHAIAEAERAGMTSFDFLRGQESYKYRWGAVDRPSHARYLAPRQRMAQE